MACVLRRRSDIRNTSGSDFTPASCFEKTSQEDKRVDWSDFLIVFFEYDNTDFKNKDDLEKDFCKKLSKIIKDNGKINKNKLFNREFIINILFIVFVIVNCHIFLEKVFQVNLKGLFV